MSRESEKKVPAGVPMKRRFHPLKYALTDTPVFCYPTTKDPCVVNTGASDFGIGVVLSQIQNEEERVVTYFSTTLTKAEPNYCVTQKELLNKVKSLKRFLHYLCGRPFKVRTNHGALKWLTRFNNTEGQLARWLE